MNRFLQSPIAKRLDEDIAARDLLLQVSGYLGSLDNKLRNNRTFRGVTLTEDGASGADSLNLTIPT